jgi:NADP-dependent aldehyde dehydrogenase
VKAHPAHATTSELVGIAISKAVKKCNLPEGVFTHLHGAGFEVGKALVTHRYTRAVGFTGSHAGGRQLFDWANQRKDPIPVFAEMSSINPVFLLPGKLRQSSEQVAKMYASSITLGVGQFCTNPGLIIGIEGEDLQNFMNVLSQEMEKVAPAAMLHPGIAKNYQDKLHSAITQEDVDVLTQERSTEGSPMLASANAEAYLKNPVLHQEVFGPYSIVIRCKDKNEMIAVAKNTEGQLTATLMATDNDINENKELADAVKSFCGRFILNGVPTGVEVCLSQHHGGPYPSTTDSRFTAVGADGIKRFARPVCFQNWPDHLLPDELKDENPLKIWRTVNNQFKI